MGKLDRIETLLLNAWRRCMARFWTLVEICLLPAVVIAVGDLLLGRAAFSALVLGSIVNLIGILLSIVAAVALISVVADQTKDFGAAYERGMRLFVPAVILVVLDAVACVGGFMIFIVPGIFLVVAFALANYAFVLEGFHGVHALAKSREYVRGHWWGVFGRGILLDAIFIAALFAIDVPVAVLLGPVVGGLVYAVILLTFVPFSICYIYELYDNLRRLAPAGAEAPKPSKGEKAFFVVCVVVGVIAIIFFTISAATAARTGTAAPPGAPGASELPMIPASGTATTAPPAAM